MTLVQNFPFFCIILSMFTAIISFVFKGRGARNLHILMVVLVHVMSIMTLVYCVRADNSYTYMMGHYPAPWGNEIRIGQLEALMVVFFSGIMFFSVLGGIAHIEKEIVDSRKNLFYIQLDLMMASLLALIYTNDLFTAYVFIEICTIAACGLIMAKRIGRVYVSAIRYMVMSLVGSGLFLIGLSLLYCITGHLLMTPAKNTLANIVYTARYQVPLTVILILLTVGLGIKSGLYPFHTWIPDAYGYTTPAASAILSSLVSKGYIFLLIKLMVRVLPNKTLAWNQMTNVLFILGIIGMMIGSIDAIKEQNVRRMTAYSSVAQIGYIYMGLGLGTEEGIVAALFHVISHGVMKALLFISISGLSDSSNGRIDRKGLTGAGFRNKLSGFGFTVGAMSMIGMPLLTGFVSKFMFASAATEANTTKMIAAWTALAVSTVLNAVYFMRTVIVLYTPVSDAKAALQEGEKSYEKKGLVLESLGIIGFVLLNLYLGTMSPTVIDIIARGLELFG